MHIFILGQGSRPSERWTEAFPDAQVLRTPLPVDLPGGIGACWVGADVEDWSVLVGRLAAERRVVVHSRHPNDEEGIRAFDAGAHGYCHSLANVAELRAIANTVLAGGLWVGPGLMTRMIRTVRSAQPEGPDAPPEGFEDLTRREQQVAMAVTTGARNKEIARQLGMSERTVKMHLGSIFQKLQVEDRVQLVLCMMNQRTTHPAD